MGVLSSSSGANVIFGVKALPDPLNPVIDTDVVTCNPVRGICNLHGTAAQGAVDVEFTMNSSLPFIMRMIITDFSGFITAQPGQKQFFYNSSGQLVPTGLYTFDGPYQLTDDMFEEFNLPPNSSITNTDDTHYHVAGNVLTITTTITFPPVTPAPALVYFGTSTDGTGNGIFGPVPSTIEGAVPVTFTLSAPGTLTLVFSLSDLNANQQAGFPDASGSYQFGAAYQLGDQSFFSGMGIPPESTITTFDTPTYTVVDGTVTLVIPVNTLVGNLIFGTNVGGQCNNSLPGIFDIRRSEQSVPTTAQGQDAVSIPVVFVAIATENPPPNPALYLQLAFSMSALQANQPQQVALIAPGSANSGQYPFNSNFTLPDYITQALALPQGTAILKTDPSVCQVNNNADLVTITVTLCTAAPGFIVLGDNSGGSCSQDMFGICQVATSNNPVGEVTPVAAVYTLCSVDWLNVSFQLSDLPTNQQAWFSGPGNSLLMPTKANLPAAISTLLGFAASDVVTIDGGGNLNVNYSINANTGLVTISCGISQAQQ